LLFPFYSLQKLYFLGNNVQKLILALPFLIFIPWFTNKEIIGGDWPHFFNETLIDLPLFPPSWSIFHGNGIGGIIPSYFLDQYLYFSIFVSTHFLHIPWEIGYKIFWFGAFLIISTSSIVFLYKTIIKKISLWQILLSSLIYTSNSYILMVVGGGQMGIALAYSVAPAVLAIFIKSINSFIFLERNVKSNFFGFVNWSLPNLKNSIIAGLILALQIMFDPRISFLVLIGILFYIVLKIKYEFSKKFIFSLLSMTFYILILPLSIAAFLHASWILPFLIFKYNPISDLGSATPTIDGLKFLSFASFSQALSLLHPNWPDNIFGKVSFMKSEFILLPIFAFSSLFFLRLKNLKNTDQHLESRGILFIAILGLLGAFLAKGANEPLGVLNILMFKYIPGIGMFRDPSKFYLFTSISYSILIPFTVYSVYSLLRSTPIKSGPKIKKYLPNLFLIFAFSYLLFLIRPMILNNLGGTFQNREVPKDYISLKDFLNKQPEFFRTLWIPQQQRFTFTSYAHPAVEINRLLKASTPEGFAKSLNNPVSQNYLSELGIKYIIVPYDSLGEIFLDDRKYDEKQYLSAIKELRKNLGFKEIQGFGKIKIFELSHFKNHFSLAGEGSISSKMISQTKYTLAVTISKPTNLIFSENFSPFWVAKIDDKKITPTETKNGLNAFKLEKTGSYSFEVYFLKEEVYVWGRRVSFVTFILLIVILLATRKISVKNNY